MHYDMFSLFAETPKVVCWNRNSRIITTSQGKCRSHCVDASLILLCLLVHIRPLLLSRGGFLWLFCQQSQNACVQRLDWAQLEWGENFIEEDISRQRAFSVSCLFVMHHACCIPRVMRVDGMARTDLYWDVFLFPCKEFEIELEGSQTLRLLCYEKSYSKPKHSKDDGEMTDKIMVKGQIKVHSMLL